MKARKKKRAPLATVRAHATTDTQPSSHEPNQSQVKLFQDAAKEIRELHQSVMNRGRAMVKVGQTMLKEAIRLGEILSKVKGKLEHGQWLPWLNANVSFHQTQANRYMRCFEKRDKLSATLNLAEALALIAGTGERPKSQGSEQPETNQDDSGGNLESEKAPVKGEASKNGEKERQQFYGDLWRWFNKLIKALGKEREPDARVCYGGSWLQMYHKRKKEWWQAEYVIYEDGTKLEVEQVLRDKTQLRLESDVDPDPLSEKGGGKE
jgi:hypothetical protein